MISVDAIKKETYEKYRVGGNYETVKGNILNFLKIRNEKEQITIMEEMKHGKNY